jgi:integrase
METVRLQWQDIDFDKLSVQVREGKGRKSRITTLADELIQPMRLHMEHVKTQYYFAGARG